MVKEKFELAQIEKQNGFVSDKDEREDKEGMFKLT